MLPDRGLLAAVALLFVIALGNAAAPGVTIEAPANDSYVNTTLDLNYTLTDTGSGVDTCWYILDGGGNSSLASCANATLSSLEDGNHSVTVYANDSAGVANSSTVYFSVDTSTTVTAALLGIDFRPSDFNFSSSSYVPGIRVFFNTSVVTRQNVLLLNMNIAKLTTSATNDIYARVAVDDVNISDEFLRTLTAQGEEISIMFKPLTFNVSGGQHNITVYFRRTSGGGITVSNVDVVLLRMRSSSNGTVRGEVTDALYTYSSTSFAPNFNWSIDKAFYSPTYMTMKQIMNCSQATNASYYFYDPVTGAASPFWLRTCSAPLYRSGGTFLDSTYTWSHNGSVMSRIGGGTCTSNITIFDFDLRDINRRFIPGFQTSNPSTNMTNTLNYSAGASEKAYLLANRTVHLYNGTSYMLSAFATFTSQSGSQAIKLFVNASDAPQATCFSKKQRTINANGENIHAFIYAICSNLTVGSNYTFNLGLNVSAGENAVVLDESLNGFEVMPYNIALLNLPPLPNDITNPAGGSAKAGMLNITWSAFSDPDGDPVAYNVSLLNSSGAFNRTINGSTSLTFQMFDTTSASDGSWIIMVAGCDNSSACANSTANFTIDNSVPAVSLQSPQNATYDTSTVDLNYTTSDAVSGVNTCWYVLDGSNTTPASCANTSLSSLSEGPHALAVYANDSAGNSNSSAIYFTVDALGPYYSSLADSPPSPATYSPAQIYSFNATWADAGTSVSAVLLESNFSGTPQNSSVVSLGSNVYQFNQTALAAGAYYYIWHANDTSGNWNSSAPSGYTVNQNSTVLTLSILPSTAVTYPTQTNATCTASNPVSITLYRNGAPVSNPEIGILPAGDYLYECNTTGSENYTANSTSSALNVSKNQSSCSLTINPSNPTYNSSTTASCSCDNPEASANLYRNGTLINSENGIPTILAAGSYLYMCNVSETENYTSAENSSAHTVNQNSTVLTLSILPSTAVTYPTQTNATCTASNPVSITLYRNGAPVSNPEIGILPAGDYLYECNTTGSENYTANSTSSALNVSKNQSSCSLTISPSNPTYNSSTTASCSCDNPEASANLYRNGTLINSENGIPTILAAGSYLYMCNVSETENYTSAENSSAHTVNQNSTVLTLSILPSTAVTYPTQTNATCTASNPVSIALYRNGAPVSNPEIGILPAGDYLYECNTTGSENYTANSTSSALNVSKNQSSCSLTINPSNPTYNSSTTASCSCDSPEENATLYRNGTDVTSENGVPTMLPAGDYLYVCNVSETENYTSASNSSNHSVAKGQTNITLALRPSATVTSGTQTNVSCTASNAEVALNLYRNGTLVGNPDVQTLAVGSYIYVCNTTGSQNYTSASGNATLRVNSPSGGGGGGALDDFTVKLNYSCAGAPLTVNVSASSARVEFLILDGSSYSFLEYEFSNSQGIATFQISEEGSYKILVTKSGYNDYSKTFQVTCTEETVNCTSDSDCDADELCSDGNCAAVPCACGYISNRTCVEYECCSDSGCGPLQVCSNNTCQALECGYCSYPSGHECLPYGCCSDSECAAQERCESNSCVPVSCPCGYVSSHACIAYACCSDSDCGPGMSCTAHSCVSGGNQTAIQPNVTFIYDGADKKLKLTVKDQFGNPLPGYSVVLQFPDGSSRTVLMDDSGESIIDVSDGLPMLMLSPYELPLDARLMVSGDLPSGCQLIGLDFGSFLWICWYWWALIPLALAAAYLFYSFRGGRARKYGR